MCACVCFIIQHLMVTYDGNVRMWYVSKHNLHRNKEDNRLPLFSPLVTADAIFSHFCALQSSDQTTSRRQNSWAQVYAHTWLDSRKFTCTKRVWAREETLGIKHIGVYIRLICPFVFFHWIRFLQTLDGDFKWNTHHIARILHRIFSVWVSCTLHST